MKKAKQKKPEPKEVKRFPVGIRVVAGPLAYPSVRVVYEAVYSDGSIHVVYGVPVYGASDSSLAVGSYRPDLFTHMNAASLLIQDLEKACFVVDGQTKEKS